IGIVSKMSLIREQTPPKNRRVTSPIVGFSCSGIGLLLRISGCRLEPSHGKKIQLLVTSQISSEAFSLFIRCWYHKELATCPTKKHRHRQ
ncbi:hypothetical protein AVEN_213770-1, partial [Araneus ventricosus]